MNNSFCLKRLFLQISRVLLITLFVVCTSNVFAKDMRLMHKGEPFDPSLFSDDLSFESLQKAIANSINYFNRVPPERTFSFNKTLYSADRLKETLQTFQRILHHAENSSQLKRMIQKQFEVHQVTGTNGSSEMLVTGYYEPVLEGSLKKKAPYLYPLYSVPADLVNNSNAEGAYGSKVGRSHNGRLVPYWSRSEIEKFDILAGSELVYLKDPVEAFILHVQGSGRVRLTDGSMRRVQYGAKNGRSYRSIGKLLIDEGKMDKEKVDMPGIVKYLKAHPQEQERILHHNESFVFFRWGEEDDEGPLGSIGEPLVAGRSIALDHNYFPSGALFFLQTQKPVLDGNGNVSQWRPTARFVLNQDCGSAIKGARRLDLFWGSDHYAKTAAGRMKHPGRLFFLIKKR